MPQFTHARPMAAKTLRKPRNPLVAPSLQRQAGRHQPAHARQLARADVRQALQDMHPPPTQD